MFLYIQDTSPLYYIWLANIISHSVCYLFTFLRHPLKHSCFLFWLRSIFLFFSFVTQAFGVISKIPLPIPRSRRYMPVFLPKSFIVLALTFMSMIHFGLTFIYSVKQGSNFIPLRVAMYCSSTICWWDCSLSTNGSWHPCWTSTDHKWEGLLFNSQYYFIGFYIYLYVYCHIVISPPILLRCSWHITLCKFKVKHTYIAKWLPPQRYLMLPSLHIITISFFKIIYSFWNKDFKALYLHCCAQAFSGCSEQGLLSSCALWATHSGGLSSCKARALGCTACGSQALEYGLSSCGTPT